MFDEELITWSIDGGGRLFYRPRHKFSVTNVGGTLRVLDTDFLNCRYLHLVLTHLHSKIRFDWVYKAHPSVIRMVYNEIPIPSLEKQREIVEKLDSIFAEIKNLETKSNSQIRVMKELAFQLIRKFLEDPLNESKQCYLDEISENLDSRRIPITRDVRTAGSFPYYGASGVIDYVDDFIFEGDALLVSEDGANLLARSTPIAFPVTGKYWVNNHAHILKFQDSNLQRFVEHFLESIKLDQYITGAAQPKLTQTALNAIPIPVPLKSEDLRQIVLKIEIVKEMVSKYLTNLTQNVIARSTL